MGKTAIQDGVKEVLDYYKIVEIIYRLLGNFNINFLYKKRLNDFLQHKPKFIQRT